MTDEELLDRAVEFDAGPFPIINGGLLNPDLADYERARHVRIVQRKNLDTGAVKWAIDDGFRYLNRHGRWEDQRRSGRMAKDYLSRCRFDSPQEAFETYLRWKVAVLAWAEKTLARKGRDAILNIPKRLITRAVKS